MCTHYVDNIVQLFSVFAAFLHLASNEINDIKREYDQEIPQSHTAELPKAPMKGGTEHLKTQGIGKTIKAKQPALSSSSRRLQS